MNFVNILNNWKFYSVHGSVSGLYILNDLGYYVDISIVIKYFSIYTVLIKWLVAYKCDYQSHIKQVIISCEFCQHFNCLEVVLGSWMSLWYLDVLGMWIGF